MAYEAKGGNQHHFPADFYANLSSPYGNRTHLSALKERYPVTDRRTGHFQKSPSALHSALNSFFGVRWLNTALDLSLQKSKAVLSHRTPKKGSVGREVLEPSSAALQAAATPSQLPAHVAVFVIPISHRAIKKPGAVLRHRVFWSPGGTAQEFRGVTSAGDPRDDSLPAARNYLRVLDRICV